MTHLPSSRPTVSSLQIAPKPPVLRRAVQYTMTRIPLSIDDQISPYIGPANGGTGSDPVAWIAIIFAAFFVIVTAWHCILLVRRQAYFTWLMVASSLGVFQFSICSSSANTTTAQCLSLVEFAYSTIYPLSTPFLVIGTLTHWLVSPNDDNTISHPSRGRSY